MVPLVRISAFSEDSLSLAASLANSERFLHAV
jgi:hypothetical protein